MAKSKKIVRSAPKRALRTAGARSAPEAPKLKIRVLQPENYGYDIILKRDAHAGFRILSGCRDLTPVQADLHWKRRRATPDASCVVGDPLCSCGDNSNVRSRARKMLKLLPLLAQRARRYGWKPSKSR